MAKIQVPDTRAPLPSPPPPQVQGTEISVLAEESEEAPKEIVQPPPPPPPPPIRLISPICSADLLGFLGFWDSLPPSVWGNRSV